MGLRILDPDENFDRMARGNGGLETSGSLLKPPSAISTPTAIGCDALPKDLLRE